MKIEFIICTADQYKGSQGIHLINPDEYYVNDSISSAERDGFEKIYLHYASVGSQYAIPSDVLKVLLDLSQNFETYTFRVIDPRGN